MISKYIGRSKKKNKACRINCPIHGLQLTFDLVKGRNKIAGVGCVVCYQNLSIIKEIDYSVKVY